MATPRKTATNNANVEEASPSVTFFILVTTATVVLALGSIVLMQANTWVQGQTLWLISRSAALAAYIVLTIVVILGILLSHPRNKDQWRLTKYLFPWHQAGIAAFTTLLVMHLYFTIIDPKSGIVPSMLAFPIHAKYHPLAMVLGAVGLYGFIAVSSSAALRKWVPKRVWMPIHRASWLVWMAVLGHGVFGGSDHYQMRYMYFLTAGLVVITLFSRHWANNRRKPALRNVETTIPTLKQTI